MPTNIKYATYPTARVFENKGDTRNIHELLWGDWVRVTGPKSGGWYPVRARGLDGFMKADDLQDERLLEVVFIDVGQGDGCLLVTPKDKHLLVDAGMRGNMYRFLRWRYAGFKKKWKFESVIITHPDSDHYSGFSELFDEENVSVGTLYHNGIIETSTSGQNHQLGEAEKIDGTLYIHELMETKTKLAAFLADEARWTTGNSGKKQYPKLLHKALNNGRVDDIRMLSTAHSDAGFLPGYGPDKELSIEVLGPVAETDDGSHSLLRWFKKFDKGGYNKGQTKNGHSVVLKLKYRDVSLLLAGDLNWAAERFLLEQHVPLPIPGEQATADEQAAFRGLARQVFQTDIVKSCHHGSADFMNLFLQASHSAATVVSSGDEESHAHPRSDTLGAIGKFGRGERPLIFSTELARSTRERESPGLRNRLESKEAELTAAETDADKAKAQKEIEAIWAEILRRNVTVYGAINLRTDGHKAVLAQRLEKDRNVGSLLQKWDVYQLERNEAGVLALLD
jgi:beta-lactamase superfamily II metal-dependent hydrolase